MNIRLNKTLFLLAMIVGCLSPIILFQSGLPDELSRLSLSKSFIKDGYFSMNGQKINHWPPFNLFLIIINPLRESIIYQRIFNFAICLPAIYLLFLSTNHLKLKDKLLILFVMPYFGSVMSLAMPQGIMIATLPFYYLAIINNRLMAASFFASILFLTNPTAIPILILTSIFMAIIKLNNSAIKIIKTIFTGYIITFPYVIFLYITSGTLSFFYSDNGLLNLYLGNNIHWESIWALKNDHLNCGSIDICNVLYKNEVVNFITDNKILFIIRFFIKFTIFIVPFDIFRSELLLDYANLIYPYLILVKLVIIYFVLNLYGNKKNIIISIIYVAAATVYAIFYTKVRFAIPFDFLILCFTFYQSNNSRFNT